MSCIKTVSVRFNCEVKPFQHIRVEVTATITKGDDKDEVRNELTEYARAVYLQTRDRIFIPNEPQLNSSQHQQPDQAPY